MTLFEARPVIPDASSSPVVTFGGFNYGTILLVLVEDEPATAAMIAPPTNNYGALLTSSCNLKIRRFSS